MAWHRADCRKSAPGSAWQGGLSSWRSWLRGACHAVPRRAMSLQSFIA